MAIAAALRNHQAVFDGEIVCLNEAGEAQFNALLFRRALPWLYGSPCSGEMAKTCDSLPLLERKRRLRRLVPRGDSRLLTSITLHNGCPPLKPEQLPEAHPGAQPAEDERSPLLG